MNRRLSDLVTNILLQKGFVSTAGYDDESDEKQSHRDTGAQQTSNRDAGAQQTSNTDTGARQTTESIYADA